MMSDSAATPVGAGPAESSGSSGATKVEHKAERIIHSVLSPHLLSKNAGDSSSLPDLGATTRTRGWVALGAVIVLLLAGLIYGVFGSYQTQTSYGGVAVGAGEKMVISANAEGVIASLTSANVINRAGAVLVEIAPVSTAESGVASKATSATSTSVALPESSAIIGWNVGLGSPVKVGDVLGDALIFATRSEASGRVSSDPLSAVSFLSLSDVQSVRSALSLTAVARGRDGAPVSAEATIVGVSAFPISEARIAFVTGNPTFAKDIMTATNGEAYEVDFGYKNLEDYQEILKSVEAGQQPPVVTGAIATIVATSISTNPLAFLFGGGS